MQKQSKNWSGVQYPLKRFPPFHSFWEEKDLSRDINTSLTVWQHYRYHEYSVSGPSNQQGSGIPFKLLCLFSSIIFLLITKKKKQKKTKTKPFRGSRLLKYLINVELIWLSVTRYKPKLTDGLICHFMLDRLHWCAKQRNRTSVLLGELWYT